ncbi:transporter [Staphylococcus gallinarum]|uniref:Transporter n=1 Tax=Staphylococcus gallinarum TaxID=1293 RepID=A0A380FGQ3_STAGA|nr:transporter [Staphylococcus gallinarum]
MQFFGIDVKIGAAITAVLSIAIFISKSGQKNNGCCNKCS